MAHRQLLKGGFQVLRGGLLQLVEYHSLHAYTDVLFPITAYIVMLAVCKP